MAEAKKSEIHIKKSHQGLLHKDLGIPAGDKIPLADIMRAKHSKDPEVRKRANFANNARHWKKG